MKNIVIVALAVALVVNIVAGGYLYYRLNGKINGVQSQVTFLRPQRLTSQNGTPQLNSIQPQATTMTMGDLISAIQPVIVRVDVNGQGFQSSRSGIIIRTSGVIITNGHVVNNATSIIVTLNNNQQYSAAIKADDANIDLAVIQLDNGPHDLPAATLGTLRDVFVGETVTAAGFPLGTALPGPASFTRGIMSATRTIAGQTYIQSDFQINPGNSGGALVTNNGKVIGITTSEVLSQGVDAEGIGLAIPIDVILTYIQNNVK